MTHTYVPAAKTHHNNYSFCDKSIKLGKCLYRYIGYKVRSTKTHSIVGMSAILQNDH